MLFTTGTYILSLTTGRVSAQEIQDICGEMMLNLQMCFLHSSKKPTCPLLKSGHAQLNHKHILDQNLKAVNSQTVFL